MAYEIDFIGIDEKSKDSDAIAIRWKEGNETIIGVYDGGLQVYGEKLQELLNQYYFDDEQEEKKIDFVVCSHSDLDHVSGLKDILANYTIRKLYMNRPWLYVDEVFGTVSDGRITKKSLEKDLKEQYKYIAELEEIANEKGIEICEAFQGEVIKNKLTILSPTKELYLKLLIESNKTPMAENTGLGLSKVAKAICDSVMNLMETWNKELLKEDVKTSSENEMSVIILGEMSEEYFLLTGDAGIRGLDVAIQHADSIGVSIKESAQFIQIPHHGGRHNISPSILDRMIGEIVPQGTDIKKIAFVSSGKDSDHPLQMVINAFTRRGAKVYNTNGKILNHQRNMPGRDGWTSAENLYFNNKVEDWDD